MINKKSKIFIAGHRGMVGSSIYKKLKKLGYKNLIVADKKILNLLDQKKVYDYLKKNFYLKTYKSRTILFMDLI